MCIDWNFCWIVLFNSGKVTEVQSLKIIQFEIVNLPLEYRKKEQYRIKPGIVSGSNLNQWIYILRKALELAVTGLPTFDANTGRTFTLKIICMPGMFDLPGFSEAFMQMQSNGKLGC